MTTQQPLLAVIVITASAKNLGTIISCGISRHRCDESVAADPWCNLVTGISTMAWGE